MDVNEARSSTRWRRIAVGAAAGLLAQGVTAPALAATYHVDGAVAQSGDGSSPAEAFQTIGECAQVAAAGDTCQIAAGTYRETVHPASSGTSGNPVVFAAAAGAVVNATAPIVEGSAGQAAGRPPPSTVTPSTRSSSPPNGTWATARISCSSTAGR